MAILAKEMVTVWPILVASLQVTLRGNIPQ